MTFQPLRVAALAMTLAFSTVSALLPTLTPAAAQAYPPRQVEYNGKAEYQAAFEAIRDNHASLLDATTREAWAKEWEHKYPDSQFANEASTGEAITAMLASLGKRFDRYLGADFVKVKETLDQDGAASIGVILRERMSPLDMGIGRDIYVDRILPGSPATGVLQVGDIIVKVDCASTDLKDNTGCRDVSQLSNRDVELALYGKADSQVILHIQRPPGKIKPGEDMRVTVTRKDMSEHAVFYDDSYGDTAVIRIVNFLPNDFEQQFADAVKKALANKCKRIVFDLRDNPGGRTDAAVNAVGNLLKNGKIMTTLHREGPFTTKQEVSAKGDFFEVLLMRVNVGQRFPVPRPELLVPEDMPIAVIINGKSASASEIFAGALKANKRATIVGTKSLGKGEGQEVVELPFGRRLHLTTFEFRAGGIAHNLVGVDADVVVAAGTTGGADNQMTAAIKSVSSPPASRSAE